MRKNYNYNTRWQNECKDNYLSLKTYFESEGTELEKK